MKQSEDHTDIVDKKSIFKFELLIFFLWVYLKDLVCQSVFESQNDLKLVIKQIKRITPFVCVAVILNFRDPFNLVYYIEDVI